MGEDEVYWLLSGWNQISAFASIGISISGKPGGIRSEEEA